MKKSALITASAVLLLGAAACSAPGVTGSNAETGITKGPGYQGRTGMSRDAAAWLNRTQARPAGR